MHKMPLHIPSRFETERLYLRPYQAGDGPWYFAMSQRNRPHLARYEASNTAMSLHSEEGTEALMREFAADWAARNCFFLGAFERASDEFVAQIYIGPVNWDLPEFIIGYFVDRDHEGQGFVTEAVRAMLGFLFVNLGAQRVSLHCSDTNVRSRRVAERCGFVLEGHIRENKRNPDDTVSGSLYFGLLKSEWEGQLR
jgi:ribosomal-protein-alanine N-acetyltransferase